MLKESSVIVADTGDFHQLKKYMPQDATTNPTLILQAIQLPEYKNMLDSAIAYGTEQKLPDDQFVESVCNKLIVNFGCEILKIIPGVVSTEIDSSLSFDIDGSVLKARRLIELYEAAGINKESVLIKMAATWEGCQAAKILESEGIRCNLTLLFSLTQAIAAAQAKATLISPFVGRISDWAKKHRPPGSDDTIDLGVESVKKIYGCLKSHGSKTIIMGASFRSTRQITAIAGCDKLTISPKLLEELSQSHEEVPRKLVADSPKELVTGLTMTEKQFRWEMNEDQMASDLLSDGIRRFHYDAVKLKDIVKRSLGVQNGTK